MEDIKKLRAEIDASLDTDEDTSHLYVRLLNYRQELLKANGWEFKHYARNNDQVWKKRAGAYLLLSEQTFTVRFDPELWSYWFENDAIFESIVTNL